jgi:hypothetical protein
MNQYTKEIFIASILSAFLYLAGATFKPLGFLSYFSIIPLNVVGFSKGYKPFLHGSLVGFVLICLYQGEIDLAFLWINLMPTLIIFSLGYKLGLEKSKFKFLNKKWDWFGVINGVLTFQFLTFVIGFAIFSHFITELPPQLKEAQQKLMAQNAGAYQILLSLLPTFMSGSWLLMIFANLHFAKRWCEKKKLKLKWKPQKPKNLPQGWDIILVIGLMILVLFKEPGSPHYMGKILASFAFLPLAIQGYFTLYKAFKLKRMKPWYFWIFVMISFMLAWPLIIVVILGFVEPVYNIGSQLDKKQN